jgi:hypothetical protein
MLDFTQNFSVDFDFRRVVNVGREWDVSRRLRVRPVSASDDRDRKRKSPISFEDNNQNGNEDD